ADECVASRRVDALAGDEIQRSRELEQMPAEAGIVEVDHPDPTAVHQQILRHEIGMYQSVAVGTGAVGGQFLRDFGARAEQQILLAGSERRQFPKSPPERLLAQ